MIMIMNIILISNHQIIFSHYQHYSTIFRVVITRFAKWTFKWYEAFNIQERSMLNTE
jgi:hypothetical protein